MNSEPMLDDVIARLLAGEPLAGGTETAQLTGLAPAQADRLQAIGRVFAGFDALRREHASGTAPASAARATGERVGAFRLVAPLGAGGMGDVWLAERADGAVEQRVAIKFPRGRERYADGFLREQRLLARLEHHGIARFVDAGSDAAGAPYLAMEYVDGVPIDQHCDAHALDGDARLALFLRVCAAVEHAHRHLVVHRDIKPANILVGRDGEPKLLDFGVGKALAADALDAPTAQPAVTFAYAAPEQLRGDPVSTATDVYALGLLLFVLLAGELPRERRNASVAALAFDGGVRQRASDVARENPHAPVAADRLAGDLDAIAGKATRAEPRERYGSVAAFADDLRRHASGLPVVARAPTRGYRARKFVQRHRAGVAAAAVAFVALAAGLAVALWQAGVARGEARRADTQATRAARIADFMTGLVREQDPFVRAGSEARSARDLVAEGVVRARADLADQPDVRAALLGVLGEATMNLGDLAGGRALLEEARGGVADDTSDAARLDGLLGAIAMRQGRQGEGLPLLDAAIARLSAGSFDDRIVAARLEVRRADALLRAGKADAALAAVRGAHATLRATLGPDRLETIDAEASLLGILDQARRDDEAEPIARALVERVERVAGPDSVRLIEPLRYRAQIEKRRDRLPEAIALFDRAIALAQRHLGPRHEALATLYSRAANLQQDAGNAEAALAQLELAEQALPAGANVERAQVLATRGQTLLDLARPDEAERALREALALRRASAGDGDALVWYSRSEWARALNAQGRRAEAKAAQLEALARLEAIMGPDAYHLTFVLRALSETYLASGEPAQAVVALRRAVALATKKYSPTHPIVVQFRVSLADALRVAGDSDGAVAEADSILALRDRPELGKLVARAGEVRAAAAGARR